MRNVIISLLAALLIAGCTSGNATSPGELDGDLVMAFYTDDPLPEEVAESSMFIYDEDALKAMVESEQEAPVGDVADEVDVTR